MLRNSVTHTRWFAQGRTFQQPAEGARADTPPAPPLIAHMRLPGEGPMGPTRTTRARKDPINVRFIVAVNGGSLGAGCVEKLPQLWVNSVFWAGQEWWVGEILLDPDLEARRDVRGCEESDVDAACGREWSRAWNNVRERHSVNERTKDLLHLR